MSESSTSAAPRSPTGAAARWRGLLRDPWLVALAALAAAQYLLLAPHLVYPDLGLSYPFQGGDTFDWLLNALALSGERVRNSVRPPALPVVLALLRRLGLLSLFPLLDLAFHHAAAVGAHLVLRRRFRRPVAFVAGLLVLFGASVSIFALEVMADLPAAILLGAACAAFLAAGTNPRRYELAGLLGGLSAVTQQAALLLPLPAAITVLLFRRGDLRRAHLWLGGALYALFPVLWFTAKRIVFGTFGDVGIKQWRLLGFQPENVPHYLLAALSLWGWPCLVLAVAGAVLSVRDLARAAGGSDDRAWALFPLLTAGTVLVFFSLFYDVLDKRFLLYAFFPSLALIARALAALRGRRAFVPIAALALTLAAWPLRNAVLATQSALWPLPPTYLVVPQGKPLHHPLPYFDRAHFEVTDLAAAGRWSLWSEVLRADRKAREPPRLAAVPDDVAVAVYFAPSGPRRPSLWMALTRLGYVVRRRVTLVMPDLYPKDWWGWRKLEPLGISDRYRLFRLALPDLPQAVFAFERFDARGRAIERRARSGAAPNWAAAPTPPRDRLRAGADLARRVGALLRGDHGAVVVLPEARGEWTAFLPLFKAGMIQPAGNRAARLRRLAAEPGSERRTVGPLELASFTRGRYSTVVVLRRGPAVTNRPRPSRSRK